ncbi:MULTISPECIES: hypothetical protein [unclassified Pseudomonas]|uniref:hypothetical protein n=1 Tax=unclassified Pseudomonas TaxID=196821 RepID=UPI0008836B16|nr:MULTISPECIES: hypothetical protein [unclassified Pseudomonas]SDB27941.1 hypothetical protein SAMN03159386_02020 [Pseudomonas sp. NFACC17-2]SEJ40855.1 hypothetical protein SAMN03159382_02360 [Pseudomonas sp. NFACC23-1]SFW66145.1 hypothetical protein SAMN05660640_02568 [Pseudomonas sp. NFACC16-2]SFY11809.1 hypothetical protein SAMN03159309_04087 [Pseudomonas sp. NFACC36]
MAMSENFGSNRIKFAYFLPGWIYGVGDKAVLRKSATSVLTSEYQSNMKGAIFCPECCVGLFRSPEEGEKDARGRAAYFAHTQKHRPPCGLRVKKRDGQRFTDEEEAKQAVDDELLVVVKSFMKHKPVAPQLQGQVYSGPVVEDIDGELSEVPIRRHNGEKIKLPSRITSVRGLCTNFNKNFHKYYFLPEAQYPQLLSDALVNVSAVKEPNTKPRLYYGRIKYIRVMGQGNPDNIQMTRIEYENNGNYQDFTLKMTVRDSTEHRIVDSAIGRVLLMYGPVSKNGTGLAISDLGWGEFALLPSKYESVLYPIEGVRHQETFEELLADAVGLTVEELEEWMESEEPEYTRDEMLVGHVVNFRDDTPESIMNQVTGRTGDYTANVGIIYMDDD